MISFITSFIKLTVITFYHRSDFGNTNPAAKIGLSPKLFIFGRLEAGSSASASAPAIEWPADT